ncbi:hypothetical protein ACHAWF_002662 [Thalassiosira exigua]
MFNWANKQLEKLSETLAPPSSVPTHRFLSALASSDEGGALAFLNDPHEPLDPHAPVHPQRGTNCLHAAAGHGAATVVRELITTRGMAVDCLDYEGRTPLHYAGSSSSTPPQAALSLVKMLVEEFGASVLSKDRNGQTPYDVATSQAVRGYLLPKQLQQETALEGAGAVVPPPPMANGGMHNMHPPPAAGGGGSVMPPPPMANGMQPPPVGGAVGGMPPPPVNSMHPPAPAGAGSLMPPPPAMNSAPPPISGGHNSMLPPPPAMNSLAGNDPSAALMQPPVNKFIVSTPAKERSVAGDSGGTPVMNSPGITGPAASLMQPPVNQFVSSTPEKEGIVEGENETFIGQSTPEVPTSQPPASPRSAPIQQEQLPVETAQQIQTHQQQLRTGPEPNNPLAPKSAPGYALRGGNSNAAAVLSESTFGASGRKLYQPDGFHSSSNDKELQAKYGHVTNEYEQSRKLAMPPPPKSGGGPGTGPPSGGVNPYSALGAGAAGNVGYANAGYIAGGGRSRYPTYGVVSGVDSVSAPPSLGGGGATANQGAGFGSPVPTYSTFNPAGGYANPPAS